MTVISFSGLASGLDTSSWVSALTALKNAKVQSLEEEKSAVMGLKDAVAGIKSYFTAFRNSLERLTDAKFGDDSLDIFLQNLANSSNPSKVTATATASAARDSYEVGVTQIATATKVNSAVRRTVTVTNSAAETTNLAVFGVREGFVSINNQEVQITDSDTIGTLVDKLNDNGITTFYDETHGRFTIATDIFESDDGATGLFAALGLAITNPVGDKSKKLMTEGYVTIKPDTTLADIGANQGQLEINQTLVNVNLGANATVADFLNFINTNYGAMGATANMDAEGFITITGIDIQEIDGGSNLITALGLVEEVETVTSMTDGLSYIRTESIKLETKLGEINSTFPNYNLVLGTAPTGGSTTALNADSTIEDVKNAIKNFADANGMDVNFNISEDGVVTIDGDIDKLYISGGVADGLGLVVDKQKGTTFESSVLEYTHTLIAKTSTTWQELGITGTNLTYSIMDERGDVVKPDLSVGENTTLEAWFNSLKQYGLEGSISEDGIISIDGDGFISGNLATALNMSSVRVGEVVSLTTATSNVLAPKVTVTATMTTTLGDLGITTDQTLTIRNGGSTVTHTFTSTDTINDIANAVKAAGGEFILDENGDVTIKNIDNLTGDLVTTFGLTASGTTGTSISATGVTYTTGSIITETSKFSDYTIDTNKTYDIYTQTGDLIASGVSAGSNTTISDFIAQLDSFGLNADITSDGRISITNGYITGDFATALDISTINYMTVTTGKSVVSDDLSIEIYRLATLDSTLADIGASGGSLILNYNGVSKTANFTTSSTLGDISDFVHSCGGKFVLSDGIIAFDDVEASGDIVGSLGLDMENVGGGATSETIVQTQLSVSHVTVTSAATATSSTTTTAICTVTSIATTTAVSEQTLTVSATTTAISTQTITAIVTETVEAVVEVTAIAIATCETVVEGHTYSAGDTITQTATKTVTETKSSTEIRETTQTVATTVTLISTKTVTTCATTTVTGTQTVSTTVTVITTWTDTTEATYVEQVTATVTVTLTGNCSYKSGQRTVKETSTTFLASETTLKQLGVDSGTSVKVKDDITGTETDVLTTGDDTTLSDLLAALEVNGYETEYSGGRIYLSTDKAISLSGLESLGVTTTTYSVTYVQNSTSKVLDNSDTKNLDSSTTLGDITATAADRILTVTIDNDVYSHTFAAGNTIADVITFLGSKGITASMTNGTFTAEELYHYMSIGGTLGDLLLGDNPTTTQTSGQGCYWSGEISEYEFAPTLNNDTKIVSLGVSEGALKIYDNGKYIDSVLFIDENTTIGDLITILQSYDINAGIVDDTLVISSDSDKYLCDESSNMVSKLGLTNRIKDKVDIFEQTDSKNMTVITTLTTDGTTSLSQLGFEDGSTLRLEIDGVVHTLGFQKHETVNDIMDALAKFGIKATIDGGVLKAVCEDDEFKFFGALGTYLEGATPNYVQTEKIYSYQSGEVKTDVKYFAAPETLLKDLGVKAGYINLHKDGELLTSIAIEDNTTVGQFFSALAAYNVTGTTDPDGVITIQSIGDITLTDGTSNLVSHLGLDDNIRICNYEGTTTVLEEEVYEITDDILVSYFDTATDKAVGSMYFKLEDQDGNIQNKVINIDEDETFGSLKQKMKDIGLTATIKDGHFSYHYGLGSVEVTGGSSDIATTLQLADANIETWMQNVDRIETEQDEIRYESVAKYADNSTTMDTLGVKAGEFSIGINGRLINISVAETDTLGNIISKISNASGGAVTASLTADSRFMLEAAAGVELILGTNTDTTNLATIFGLSQDGSNIVTGETTLYKASANTKLLSSGVFRLGNISAGTFTIGEAEFTIDANTTIASLVNDINRSEGARASAYWDNINGKLVLTSIDTGANYLNIEKGSSNFTEIFGLTVTDAGVRKLATYNQVLGNNAILMVNDTRIVSTSNTVTSDISRIEGLTINVKDVTPGDYVTITVERDTQSIIDAVESALYNYNNLIAELNSALEVGGNLNGDTTLSAIKHEISSLFTSKGTNGTALFRNMAAVGISTEAASSAGLTSDIYSLYLDKDKFINALEESENDVKLLLVGTVDNPGILTKVESLLENILSANGYFSTKNRALNRQIENYDRKIEAANRKTEHYKTLLERKFSNMELLYSTMNKSYSQLLSAGIG